MEQEAREILRATLQRDEAPVRNLGTAIHGVFRPLGGVDLDVPPRAPMREHPRFDRHARRMIVLDTNVFLELMRASPDPRVLPFDTAAARVYAELACERRAAGRPISQFDCQIAAIARSRGMAVATRDAEGLVGCGIAVIDPWSGR